MLLSLCNIHYYFVYSYIYLHCLLHQLTVPCIFLQAGKQVCNEDWNEGFWPKTPAGATVINRTCASDRVGYKSRTCEGSTWQPVFSYCVKQELNNIVNAAEVSVAKQPMTIELWVR